MIKARFLSIYLTVASIVLVDARLALASEGEGAAKVGLPQLDTSFYAGQLFWLAVSFGVLYFLMAKVALPAVRRTQDTRSDLIKGELAAASAANDAAKAMIAQYEKALSDARSKAGATVSSIVSAAAKDASAREQAAQQEMTRRLGEAESRLRTARDAAIADIKSSASDLAQAITAKVLERGA